MWLLLLGAEEEEEGFSSSASREIAERRKVGGGFLFLPWGLVTATVRCATDYTHSTISQRKRKSRVVLLWRKTNFVPLFPPFLLQTCGNVEYEHTRNTHLLLYNTLVRGRLAVFREME